MATGLGLMPGYSTSATGGGYDWTPQDDKVDTEVSRITQADSPLMRQARADGYAAANKRGLINSSMAVNAAQQSVLNAALPMAQQNAQQTAQKNLSSQDYGQSRGLQDQKFGFDTKLSEQGYEQSRGLQDQKFGFDTKLSEQNFQQSTELQGQKFGYDRTLAADQSFYTKNQIDQENAWKSGLLQQENEWKSKLAGEDFARQTSATQQKADLESRLQAERSTQASALAAQQAQYQQSLAQLDADSRKWISSLQADTASKGQAAAMLAEMERAYSSNIQSIAANTQLPAEERDKYLSQFKTLRESSLNMFEQFYGYSVDWGTA
jgi:hypothetical protein